LTILESVSLLGVFPASCDLIKNPPILVAIYAYQTLFVAPSFIQVSIVTVLNLFHSVTLNSQFYCHFYLDAYEKLILKVGITKSGLNREMNGKPLLRPNLGCMSG